MWANASDSSNSCMATQKKDNAVNSEIQLKWVTFTSQINKLFEFTLGSMTNAGNLAP